MLLDLFPPASKMRSLVLDKKALRLCTIGEHAAGEISAAAAFNKSGAVNETLVVLQDTALKENRKRAAQAAREKQPGNTKKRRCEVNLTHIAAATSAPPPLTNEVAPGGSSPEP